MGHGFCPRGHHRLVVALREEGVQLSCILCAIKTGVLESQGHEEGQRKSQGGRSELRWGGEKGISWVKAGSQRAVGRKHRRGGQGMVQNMLFEHPFPRAASLNVGSRNTQTARVEGF